MATPASRPSGPPPGSRSLRSCWEAPSSGRPVLAGAFLVNLTTTGDPASSLGIATGNTLEALVAAYLTNRFASGKDAFSHPRTVLLFVLFAGLLAPTVAASTGTASLVLAHLAAPSNSLGVWLPWWLGDAIGAIEVTPLILAFAQRPAVSPTITPHPTAFEAVAVGATTLAVALIVFARDPSTLLGGYPLVFLVIPPVVWAAFRFGARGATASVSMVSVVAIAATVAGDGPFASLPPGISLLALRVFAGSLAVTALIVAADALQHRRLEGELNHARKELQRMLRERTAELDSAKSLAEVGTWSFDVPTQKMIWSDEMYRMLGYGSDRFPVVIGHLVERLHPDDRKAFITELQATMGTPEASSRERSATKYRILLDGDAERTLLNTIRVAGVENGHVTRVGGTTQDVTERQHIEDELRRLAAGETTAEPDPKEFRLWMIPSVGPPRRKPARRDSGNPGP